MKVRSDIIGGGTWSAEIARKIDGMLRDVRAILNGGFRFGDQAQVRTFRWNSASPAAKVTVASDRPPLGLWVIRAARVTDPATAVSGVHVTWKWNGRECEIVTVGSISTGLGPVSALALSVDYDVTVLVVEG